VRSILASATGLQQKDNLCGPFWAARVLIEAGFIEWWGDPIDEDLIAARAGTTLPAVSDEPSLPRGASSLTNYRYELPIASPAESGTSADGLMRAIESASGGALRCVPVRGRWTAERVERLVSEAPDLGARLIANVRTGRLWTSRPDVDVLLDELAGRPVEEQEADWDAGHFIELVMLIRGPRNALIVVHDSYPTLGAQARHLQPPRALAAALLRGDGREGGVLAVVARENANGVAALVGALGLEIGTWNNGSRSADHGDR
jgi:uncharacterized protein DUF6885